MHAEAPRHRRAARGVFVNVLFQMFSASDVDFLDLDGKVTTKDAPCDAATVATVAEVAAALVGK